MGCFVFGGIAGVFGFTGMAGDWSGLLKGVLIVASFAALCASAYDVARLTQPPDGNASRHG
jgi:hypothetical protein